MKSWQRHWPPLCPIYVYLLFWETLNIKCSCLFVYSIAQQRPRLLLSCKKTPKTSLFVLTVPLAI